jgi:hypothetical protein
MLKMILIGATATCATVMLLPRNAGADHHGPHCEAVSGQLEEDPGGAANCPAGHPGCFIGAIDGHKLHATTLFFGEGAAAAPPNSPNWFSYTGVTTYTMRDGSITTRETGLVNGDAIAGAQPDGATASLSMEVITSGTGSFAGATGYLFVNGFSDDNRHVSSLVLGRICTP